MMMPDNWSYVVAAYLLAALAVGGYWRHLGQRRRAVAVRPARRGEGPA
jgi:hypothetical protein